MAMLELLRGMKPNLTVYGFRSTFRDWAAEETIHAREVAEAALTHIRRGDFFEKRLLLMEEWDRYAMGRRCANKTSKRPTHAARMRLDAAKRTGAYVDHQEQTAPL